MSPPYAHIFAFTSHFSSKLQAAEMTITEAIARSNIDIMAQVCISPRLQRDIADFCV